MMIMKSRKKEKYIKKKMKESEKKMKKINI